VRWTLINELVETNSNTPLTVVVGQTHHGRWRGVVGAGNSAAGAAIDLAAG
jgi:hypothetical protein